MIKFVLSQLHDVKVNGAATSYLLVSFNSNTYAARAAAWCGERG